MLQPRCRPLTAPSQQRRQHSALRVLAASSASASRSQVSDPFEHFVLATQREIIAAAEALDRGGGGSAREPPCFVHDRWQRSADHPNAGYGITSVLEGGSVIEKGAVNISIVSGVLSRERATQMSSRGRHVVDPGGGQSYSACALSLVFHSAHPAVPTLRADVRLFEVEGRCWYGGGCDLTPFYLREDDTREFHAHWKELCGRYDPQLYPEFKSWCDRYFYLPARKEHRGVGGIFFDDLDAAEEQYDVEQFVRDVARGILPSWAPIVERRRGEPFTPAQRDWQLLRRGRYIEFNLLYDRGVRFGLDGGRVESIMVSAPPLVAWRYNVRPDPGSPEWELVQALQAPRDWA